MLVIKNKPQSQSRFQEKRFLPGCEYQEAQFIGRIYLETSYYSVLDTLVPPPL